MLQARMRGSKEWYRPDRDFMVSHPSLLSRSIAKLTEEIQTNTRGPEDATVEFDMKRLGDLATELAKLHNACGNREMSAEQLTEQLTALEAKYPYLTLKLAIIVFQVSFEMYRHWKLETLPENPDGTIDHTKLSLPLQVQPAPIMEGPK